MSATNKQHKHGRLGGVQNSRNLSNIRNAQMTIPYRNGISATLRATQIIATKAALPAELIAVILDYVAIPDLMRCARVSKRLQEMVYDDTRWVQRLKLMNAWDERAARQHFEDAMRKKAEKKRTDARDPTLFDARAEEAKTRHDRRSDGFKEIPVEAPVSPLGVFSRVRSIRGYARQEFAKVYSALIPFYNDMAKSPAHADHLVFRTFQTPEDQAKMLFSLARFAKQDNFADTPNKLESLIDVFQRAVLHEFHQGILAGDVDNRMKRYANVLNLLGRGTTAINMYISLVPGLQTTHNPLLCLEDIASGHVDLNPCNRFFEHLSRTTQRHASEIDRIFPQEQQVMSIFLSKLWIIIEDYSTALFDESHRLDRETYCKAVAGTFGNALRLIAELQPFATSVDNFTSKMQPMLQDCFSKHVDRYLAEESALFKDKSDTEVSYWERQLSEQQATTESFFMSNVSRQAAKRDFLSSFRKVVMMPVTVISPFGSKKTVPVVEQTTPKPDAPMTELAAKTAIMNSRLENIKSLFSLDVAINLTQYAKTSLERTALLVQMGDSRAKEHCESIFVEMLRTLGTRHIQAGFDKALEHLGSYDPRQVREYRNKKEEVAVEPLVTFLELVNVGDLIQQMIEVFYSQELIMTKLIERDDFLDPAVIEKKTFEQMLDARVAAGLNKGIDVLMSEVEFICASTQQATDFNPLPIMREKQWSQPDIDIGASNTAQQVIEIVSGHTNMLIGSTDKSMLDVFLQEVATRLFGAICKHVKRQRISVTGSIKLISDLNHYAAFITGLRQKAVLPYAAVLKEIGQIYLIHIDPPSGFGKTSKTQQQSKELATIVADTNRYWGILPVEEVYEFAERRADWHIVKSDVDRAMYGVGCSVM